MANNKKTIFQKLNTIFDASGVNLTNINTQTKSSINKYSISNDILLKTQSKEEYETAKLQAQQSKFLGGLWKKSENELIQHSMHYETTRIGSYADFESMEFYPEIAAALDIFMEEASTLNSKGKVLNIFSESKRVQTILEDLFFNRLDIQASLPMWTRNLPVREDSIIPLLNGEFITIKEIAQRIKENPNETIWTYSVQDITNKIVPSKIIWCDLTRKNSQLVRVTLDDGTYLDTTPDHEYIMRDGSKKRADELIEGQSLMPFYTKISNEGKKIKGYELVFNPESNEYEHTYKLITEHDLVNIQNKITSDSYYTTHNVELTDTIEIINHKVISVQFLDETSDVYCMEVVGKDNEQDRHNFPICSKDKNGNYTRNGVFVSNCKYGDNFLMLNLDDKKGIVGARQLPNFEIERKEGDVIYNQYSGEYKINNDSESAKVKFFWRGKDFEFNSWQIAHFRLLGDDRRLPYGTSLLEKARSIWKRLQLAEDAMLVYRITRAPERRVFKIYVGNIDDNDVPAYVDEIANRFKRKPVIDPQTGQIDLRYNQLANDQDYFIPVRDENAPTPIDTLPGAGNLDQIADILFLQRKLFTALRVPKTFLGFEEATGDGKNLALQDIRFSRTINRIQQAVIAELNKIAIIHLYMLGFEDELSNFNLSLNNPSTQAEMLKIEQLQAKMSVYKDAISDAGNGFMGMSMTRARREILGWSDEEIRKDFLEQRLEKAAAAEIEQSSTVIKRTGIFDEVDALYGDMSASGQPTEGEDDGNESFGGGGGSFGGGSSSTPDFGTEETPEASEETPESGEEIPSIGGTETPEESGEEAAGTETEPLAERRGKGTNLINENVVSNNKKRLIERQSYVNKLLDNVNEEDKIIKEGVKIYDKNLKINEHINSIINDIDDMLKK
jgi:hypothetical protein